jgi:histidyl-tRNA synthetase
MVDEVFSRLGIAVEIRLNNRKILAGIAEVLGQENNLIAFTVALDKLDKSGSEKVLEELRDQGFNEQAINRLIPLMNLKGDYKKKFEFLQSFFKNTTPSNIGLKGIEELEKVFSLTSVLGLKNEIVFDISLARGLNYYTGAIIEVKAKGVEIGSVCGGGRYDDLTGIFGLPGISGVGISFGADRIYDVLNHLGLFPEKISSAVKLMFVNFGEAECRYILPLLKKIRMAGINAELYPDDAKMKKQMNYANSNSIPFVAIVGEEEMKKNVISLKEMSTGEQKSLSLPELLIFPGLKEPE